MNISRRSFSALAAAAVAGAVVTGCTGPTPSDEATPNSTDGAGTQPPGDGGTFTYWSMWKEGEAQQKVLSEEIKKFTDETGIAVEVQWTGREVLAQLIPRLTAGNPPDLVDQGAPDFAANVGVENLMDLSDAYDMQIPGEDQKVSDVVPEALMHTMQNDSGAPFLVPYEIVGSTLWYNAKATEGVEGNVGSWDDFITYLEERKAAGRVPIALDGDITDYCGYWLELTLLRAGGPGTIREAAQDATGDKFTEGAWVAATEAVEQLIQGGFFPEGFQGTKFPTQQAAWADQSSDTDFILMGSWLPSETTGSLEKSGGDPDSIKFASVPFPAVGDNLGEGLVVAQPVGFAVPNKAKNADQAKQFAAWFMGKERQQRIATDASNLPARTDVNPPEVLADFFEEYKNAKETVLFADGVTIVAPQWVTDVWQPNVASFFGGKLSAAEFREELKTKTAELIANS
ncbi:MAG: ABC transporter substrate-binding protein [Arachnia sp.]